MIHYFIQVLLFQTLFLAVYDLFLKKETFFQWNRAYLIISSILAYIIPFIKINSISSFIKDDMTFDIPTILVNSNSKYLDEVVLGNIDSKIHFSALEIIYITGILVTTMLFAYKVNQIYKKIKHNKIIKNKDYYLVILPKQTTAFSFFSYLFLGKSIFQKEHQHIIEHELIHIKQKHSMDLLFFELQKIIFWMNPFSYLFQHKTATLHEYIADAKAIKEHPKQQFFENLLHQTFQVEKISFINQFYKKSLIKKRIIMATKNKSKAFLKLKYLLILPIILLMIIFTGFTTLHNNSNKLFNYNTLDLKRDSSNGITAIKDTIKPLPFSEITKTPVYPGCESTNKNKAKKCTIEKISKYVGSNFNTELANSLQLPAGMKHIFVRFIIDKNGYVTNVKARAPHPELVKEAIRIVKLLPKMSPGELDGKPISIRYNLPINFVIKGDGNTNKIDHNIGLIDGQSESITVSKKELNTIIIKSKNASSFDVVKSFKVIIQDQPSYLVKGNKLDKKIISAINDKKEGDTFLIYTIRIEGNDKHTTPIVVTLK